MGCTTCRTSGTGSISNIITTPLPSIGCDDHCACPEVDVTDCEELQALKQTMDNRNCTNAEHVDPCNIKSASWYMAKFIENQSCLDDTILLAICDILKRLEELEN